MGGKGRTPKDPKENSAIQSNISNWFEAIVVSYWILRQVFPNISLFSASDLYEPISTIPLYIDKNKNPAHHINFQINKFSKNKGNLVDGKCIIFAEKRRINYYFIGDDKVNQFLKNHKFTWQDLAKLLAYYNGQSPSPSVFCNETEPDTSPALTVSDFLQEAIELREPETAAVANITTANNEEEKLLNRVLHNMNQFLVGSLNNIDPAFKNMLRLCEYTNSELERFKSMRLNTDELIIVYLAKTGTGKSFFINLICKNAYPQNYTEIFSQQLIRDNIKTTRSSSTCMKTIPDYILNDHPLVEDISDSFKEEILTVDFITDTYAYPQFSEFYERKFEEELRKDNAFKEVLLTFATTGTLTKDEKIALSEGAFLFPSKINTKSTTSFPIIVKGGMVPALKVQFFTPQEYARIPSAPVVDQGLFPDKQYRHYFAKGADVNLDRLYIKYILRSYFENNQLSPIIKDVTVYLPIEFLMGKRISIVDAPGTDDLDSIKTFQRRRVLEVANHINVLLDRELEQSENVWNEIEHCKFINKLIVDSMNHSISFITMLEKDNPVSSAGLTDVLHSIQEAAKNTKAYFHKLVEEKWRNSQNEHLKSTLTQLNSLDFLKGNIESYYAYPLLFSSLVYKAHSQAKQNITVPPQIASSMLQTNMMMVYSKTYQLVNFRLLHALQYLDEANFSRLDMFYEAFSFRTCDLSNLSPIESRPRDVQQILHKLEDLIKENHEQYLDLYLKRHVKMEQVKTGNTTQLLQRLRKVKTDELFLKSLVNVSITRNTKASNLEEDTQVYLTYEVVREFCDYLFDECANQDLDSRIDFRGTFVLYSFIIRVFLYDLLCSLIPKYPTKEDIYYIYLEKIKQSDEATVQQALDLCFKDFNSTVIRHYKRQICDNIELKENVLFDAITTVFLQFKLLVDSNVHNSTGQLILPETLLSSNSNIIKQLAVKMNKDQIDFKRLYVLFQQSYRVFRNIANIPTSKITSDLLQTQLLYPKTSFAGFGDHCYSDCLLDSTGFMLFCNSCKSYYHLSCNNEKKHQNVTKEEVQQMPVVFCYDCEISFNSSSTIDEATRSNITLSDTHIMEGSHHQARKKQRVSLTETFYIDTESEEESEADSDGEYLE